MNGVEPISVVVLGGYLGAGKTTLVNHLLRTGDERTVVVVNDFGELAIDADLIGDRDGDTITLTNGCVCCSMGDDLAGVLDDVRALTPRPERMVVETSGVADPAAVAAYAHRRDFRLDLMVVLADAEQIRQNLDDRYVGETVAGQLAAADVVVLNKVDLVDSAEAAAAHTRIAAIVVDRPIVRAIGAEVVLDFEVGGGGAPSSASPGHVGFATWSAEWTGTVALDSLIEQLEALPPGVVRVKGIVETDVGARLVHRVGPRLNIDEAPPSDRSRLVAIGLPGAILASELRPSFP